MSAEEYGMQTRGGRTACPPLAQETQLEIEERMGSENGKGFGRRQGSLGARKDPRLQLG